MITQAIRVLIVDDSAVVRGLLSRALETDTQISIVGTVMHGERALAFLSENEVDVVILDVEMPVMDGLTALKHIQEKYPNVSVVMASGLTQEGAETTVKALALGAAGCIAKPVANNTAESINQVVRELVPLVKALGKSRITPADSASRECSTIAPTLQSKSSRKTPSIVVIGSSTGGPRALSEVLTRLPRDFVQPILIVQHMPPMFTPMLAKHLEADTGRPCSEAKHGEPILHKHTYVAPGDYHLVVNNSGDQMVMTLNQGPEECYCRPSVNPMYRSVAKWYGSSTLGVILTGMGEDGKEGAKDIVERQGYMIAQDEASSVVWGMPGAVVKAKLAHEVLPLQEIPRAILQLCSQEVCRT